MKQMEEFAATTPSKPLGVTVVVDIFLYPISSLLYCAGSAAAANLLLYSKERRVSNLREHCARPVQRTNARFSRTDSRRGGSLFHLRLTVPQRLRRIHSGGSAREDVTCHQSYGGENQRGRSERGQIVRADMVEEARHELGEQQCRKQSNADARNRQHHTLPDHQTHNVCAFRSQGHADAQFLTPLRHGVSEYTVKS